jgi:hypothetical protein
MDVILNDTGMDYDQSDRYFIEADQWAQKNCTTYIGYTVQDVSDVSYVWDQLACYEFRDEKDVVLFTLRWKNN